ncbi:hypothetical protein ACFLV5_03810 [Chloroflexota bacterium]
MLYRKPIHKKVSSNSSLNKTMQWLEHHYKENFFLYIDMWDPHEPWDAPNYYTELYWPDYDGEVIDPLYTRCKEVPGFTEEKLQKAIATYCGGCISSHKSLSNII